MTIENGRDSSEPDPNSEGYCEAGEAIYVGGPKDGAHIMIPPSASRLHIEYANYGFGDTASYYASLMQSKNLPVEEHHYLKVRRQPIGGSVLVWSLVWVKP